MKTILITLIICCVLYSLPVFPQAKDTVSTRTEEYCALRILVVLDGSCYKVMRSSQSNPNPMLEIDGECKILVSDKEKPFSTVESVLNHMNTFGWEAFELLVNDVPPAYMGADIKRYTIFLKRKYINNR
jgi:hypothetical protein